MHFWGRVIGSPVPGKATIFRLSWNSCFSIHHIMIVLQNATVPFLLGSSRQVWSWILPYMRYMPLVTNIYVVFPRLFRTKGAHPRDKRRKHHDNMEVVLTLISLSAQLSIAHNRYIFLNFDFLNNNPKIVICSSELGVSVPLFRRKKKINRQWLRRRTIVDYLLISQGLLHYKKEIS